MTAYRKREAKASELEDEALGDLVARMRALRRRVALPVIIVSMSAGWIGGAAHLFGYWPLFGTGPDGSYYVNVVTVALAAALCAVPVIAPGAGIYFALRVRLRRAWRKAHVEKGVSGEWLGENVHRFG